jgi:hypothetical protein
VKLGFSKYHIGALVLGLTCMSWAAAQEAGSGDELPTAESILERYVEVTGGADAYEHRTSEIARGTMEIRAAGITGQLETQVRPGLQRTRIELPNIGVVESGVSDGVAWESNPISGPRILEGSEAEYTILSAQPNAPLHWQEQYPGAKTAGTEDVGGEPSYRVVMTDDVMPVTMFFSVDTGLLLKTQLTLETQVGKIPVEQVVDDYSDFGGILTPSKTTVNQAGNQIIITLNSAETNVDIPDERFAPPEAVQALLQ